MVMAWQWQYWVRNTLSYLVDYLWNIWDIWSIWWIFCEIFEIFEIFYFVDYLLWVLSPAACASNPLISPYPLIIITAIYIGLLDIIIFGFLKSMYKFNFGPVLIISWRSDFVVGYVGQTPLFVLPLKLFPDFFLGWRRFCDKRITLDF